MAGREVYSGYYRGQPSQFSPGDHSALGFSVSELSRLRKLLAAHKRDSPKTKDYFIPVAAVNKRLAPPHWIRGKSLIFPDADAKPVPRNLGRQIFEQAAIGVEQQNLERMATAVFPQIGAPYFLMPAVFRIEETEKESEITGNPHFEAFQQARSQALPWWGVAGQNFALNDKEGRGITKGVRNTFKPRIPIFIPIPGLSVPLPVAALGYEFKIPSGTVNGKFSIKKLVTSTFQNLRRGSFDFRTGLNRDSMGLDTIRGAYLKTRYGMVVETEGLEGISNFLKKKLGLKPDGFSKDWGKFFTGQVQSLQSVATNTGSQTQISMSHEERLQFEAKTIAQKHNYLQAKGFPEEAAKIYAQEAGGSRKMRIGKSLAETATILGLSYLIDRQFFEVQEDSLIRNLSLNVGSFGILEGAKMAGRELLNRGFSPDKVTLLQGLGSAGIASAVSLGVGWGWNEWLGDKQWAQNNWIRGGGQIAATSMITSAIEYGAIPLLGKALAGIGFKGALAAPQVALLLGVGIASYYGAKYTFADALNKEVFYSCTEKVADLTEKVADWVLGRKEKEAERLALLREEAQLKMAQRNSLAGIPLRPEKQELLALH